MRTSTSAGGGVPTDGTNAATAVEVSDSVVSATVAMPLAEICTLSPATKPEPFTATTPPTGALAYQSESAVGPPLPGGDDAMSPSPGLSPISVAGALDARSAAGGGIARS